MATKTIDESAATNLDNWDDNSGAAMSSGSLTLSSGDYYAIHDTALPDDCWWRFEVDTSTGNEYFIPKTTYEGTGFVHSMLSSGTALNMSFMMFWNTTSIDGGFEGVLLVGVLLPFQPLLL